MLDSLLINAIISNPVTFLPILNFTLITCLCYGERLRIARHSNKTLLWCLATMRGIFLMRVLGHGAHVLTTIWPNDEMCLTAYRIK